MTPNDFGYYPPLRDKYPLNLLVSSEDEPVPLNSITPESRHQVPPPKKHADLPDKFGENNISHSLTEVLGYLSHTTNYSLEDELGSDPNSTRGIVPKVLYKDEHLSSASILLEPKESARINPHSKKRENDEEICRDPIADFMKLAPIFNTIKGQNYSHLLVMVLRKCHHQTPLQDLHMLLYPLDLHGKGTTTDKNVSRIYPDSPQDLKEKGLEFCRLVLETFRLPNVLGYPSTEHLVNNLCLFSLNFGDILRTFLAIKIILDILQPAKNWPFEHPIPRVSVYKAYFIISHRLLQNRKKLRNTLEENKSEVLNQSQFGKLVNIVFPKLGVKRVGKRGDSKFHYTGIKWNKLLVDSELMGLINLGFPELETHFKKSEHTKPQESCDLRSNLTAHEDLGNLFNAKTSYLLLNVVLSFRKPLYSFLDCSLMLPSSECFPRNSNILVGQIPQQSEWARTTMQKSVEALKKYNVDMSPLILQVENELFSAESIEIFLEYVLQILDVLMKFSTSGETCLHLFLIVSLFIFPVCFASEKEIPFNCKQNFRDTLSNFVSRIDNNLTGLSLAHRSHLKGFTKILSKMITSNKVLLSGAKTSLVKPIIRVMSGKQKVSSEEITSEQNIMLKVIYRGVLMSCNALKWEFVVDTFRSSLEYQAWFVKKVTDAYMKSTIVMLNRLYEMPGLLTEQDWKKPTYELTHHIFISLFQTLHEVFMLDAFVLQLPIKFVELMVTNITNEFQTVTFHRFGKLDKDLSSETFKTWWVYSTAVQEYMSIISEILALSVRVA